MKILTASQMREVDRLTIESGIPGLVLMENAGCRLVDVLRETFTLSDERVMVVCGKGNNGGDGFVIARQLFVRALCRQLTVLELFDPESLSGDAKANRGMLAACGCAIVRELPRDANLATLVIDAVLGTGLTGPAKGQALEGIGLINNTFPLAKKVAVEIPSGLPSDATSAPGEFVRTDITVTFTAPKRSQCLSPSYEWMGKLVVVPIGSPDSLLASCALNLTTVEDLSHLFVKRQRNSNKGMYGHVLVAGGSVGKNGAPVMSGLAAYRSGAGLVTISSPAGPPSHPELMTEPLSDAAQLLNLLKKMTVLALGPGLGTALASSISGCCHVCSCSRRPCAHARRGAAAARLFRRRSIYRNRRRDSRGPLTMLAMPDCRDLKPRQCLGAGSIQAALVFADSGSFLITMAQGGNCETDRRSISNCSDFSWGGSALRYCTKTKTMNNFATNLWDGVSDLPAC